MCGDFKAAYVLPPVDMHRIVIADPNGSFCPERFMRYRTKRRTGLFLFAAIILLAAMAFAGLRLQERAENGQREKMQALCREAVFEYYLLNGRYPVSMEEIEPFCSWHIWEEKYRIRYTYYGEQIFPGIGIYRKGEA